MPASPSTALPARRLLFSTLAGLAAGACLPVAPVRAQVRDLNDAVNKAGRQRMLSQRMAKAYLALGQRVRSEQAERILADSMALFDRQLVELKAFAPAADIRTTYESLERDWSRYKAALVGTQPSRDGGQAVLQAAARVLELAHQGTTQLERSSARPVARLVNVSGRQRMLSQRMAALYLGASWGLAAGTAPAQLEQARSEFNLAHDLLRSASELTPEIKAGLDLAQQQFTFFDNALRNLQPGRADARAQAEVLTSSERILEVMDTVTGQFARLA